MCFGESYSQAARSRVDQLKGDIQVRTYSISSEIWRKVSSRKSTVKIIWECQHLGAALQSLASRREARRREAEVCWDQNSNVFDLVLMFLFIVFYARKESFFWQRNSQLMQHRESQRRASWSIGKRFIQKPPKNINIFLLKGPGASGCTGENK